MIIIKPTGGLCNYLRVIFSYYEYARKNNSELHVIWIKSNSCPGYFLDYFEPIPHVSFNKQIDKDVKIDYNGCFTMKNFQPKYDKLKLKSYIEKIVFDKLDILNKNYISVHIRRTDHIQLAKYNNRYTDDEEFINFLDKSDNNKNIYIAADNEITYNKFKKKYQNRIKIDYHKTNNNSLRKTSLQDAIIDIYICVYSDDFMGSGWSSFSGLIKSLRML
uniref:Glycosyltransferase n=1 Tax=viral metagenome TaxID=1070528 RepID=A0A6C0J8K2_9ZZZZ